MTTFPKELLNTISLGDTLLKMSELPNECVDLVVTSPPYGVGKNYELDEGGQRTDIAALLSLARGCFQQYERIVKPGGYVVWQFGDNTFGKQEFKTEVHTTIPMGLYYFKIGTAYCFELQATRIWRKNFASMGVPFICNQEPRPLLDYEHIWFWRKPDGIGEQVVREHRISRRGVWDTTKDGLAELDEPYQGKVLKGHGAAFPLAIPKWAIKLYSDSGDVVLDNFMGTGTTAVAAAMLGRNYYGIEKNPEWVQYSLERLKQGQQLPMEMK